MQWKKALAAGSIAALMAGSTVAFAQSLSNYPQPFVEDGSANFLVVVGASADPADVIGAVDVATRLGGSATQDVAVPGSSATVSVVGEGAAIQTANEKIYLGDHLKKIGLTTALTETDMPALLKSGTVSDSDEGTTYDYDLFIDFDNDYTLQYKKISGDQPDPVYMFGEFTTAPTSSTFTMRSRVIFTDEVNITVVGEKINLFGGQYTFSSGSVFLAASTAKVELFGGSDTRLMEEGETVTVTIEGTTYDVKMIVVSDADTIGIQVGSDSKSIDKGKSATVGGLEVFIDDVFFTSKQGTVSSASVLLGARRIILEHGSQVKTKIGGESEKTLDGTFVQISRSASKLTGIDVYVAGPSSKDDYLKVGGTLKDPVWKTFSLAFPSISTDVKDSGRDKIDVVPSGTKDTDLTFTNDRGSRGTIKWSHIDGSGDSTPQLADDNNDTIIVVENSPIDRNQYFVLDSGDFSRIFELTSASSLGTADAKLDIKDVMSGKTMEVKLGAGNNTNKVIDGQTYYFNATTATSTTDINLRITWGDGSAQGGVGTYTTVWPTLKTQRGARVALTIPSALTISGNTNLINLPTGTINASVQTNGVSANITAATTEKSDASVVTPTTATIPQDGTARTLTLGRTATGATSYNLTFVNSTTISTQGTLTIRVTQSTGNGIDPAVIIVEEQDDGSNVYSIVVSGDTETRSSNEETSPGAPVFSYSAPSGTTVSGSPDSDSDLTKSVDLWGTYTESKTTDQNKVWVYYPDQQISANVFVLGEGASTSSAGGATGGTVKAAVPIKTAVGKLDSEVGQTDRSTKNVIAVGGPCANSLTRELLGSTAASCLSDFEGMGYTAGQAMIKLVNNAFGTGTSALIVAGRDAADTRAAAKVLQAYDDYALTGTTVKVSTASGTVASV